MTPMFPRAMLPLVLIGVLTGCKASIEAELDVSDLRERPTVPLFVTAEVGVDDCERVPGGSERPGSLDRAQWVLSGVFPDTRYSGCTQRGDRAAATFRNMVVIDGAPDDDVVGQSHVNILITEDALRIGIPDYVQGNIERVRDQVGNRSEPSITTSLVLVNDSDTPFEYRAAEGVDDGEVQFGPASRLEAGRRARVDLPEAFAARVLDQGRAEALRFQPPG